MARKKWFENGNIMMTTGKKRAKRLLTHMRKTKRRNPEYHFNRFTVISDCMNFQAGEL
jgi:hypothetical protein